MQDSTIELMPMLEQNHQSSLAARHFSILRWFSPLSTPQTQWPKSNKFTMKISNAAGSQMQTTVKNTKFIFTSFPMLWSRPLWRVSTMEVASLSQIDTRWPADSLEFCPHAGAADIFVCGTYKLEESTENQSETSGGAKAP